MNFKTTTYEESSFQITPLIDVVFLLLFSFMVMSVFLKLEAEISIQVPQADQGQFKTRAPGVIVVNVNSDGVIRVNRRTLTLGELRDRLKLISEVYPEQTVVIRGDEDSRHGSIMGVVDTCLEADITNVSFAVTEQGGD